MGFVYLLNFDTEDVAFETRFNIPQDIQIEYYPRGNIENDRHPRVVFLPLIAILEGDVRFPVDPLLLRTLSFYGLSPDQCLPKFYGFIFHFPILKLVEFFQAGGGSSSFGLLCVDLEKWARWPGYGQPWASFASSRGSEVLVEWQG